MSTDLELARADARRAYAEMEDIHSILLEHGCEPGPDGLRTLIKRIVDEAMMWGLKSEQYRTELNDIRAAGGDALWAGGAKTLPEAVAGLVAHAQAMSDRLVAADDEVKRLRAELDGIHAILLGQDCDPSIDGLRHLTRVFGCIMLERDALNACWAERDAEIARLRAEPEQTRAAMTTPEGYVGQVKEAVAEEVERLRAVIAKVGPGYRLEWSGDWLVLVVGPYRFAAADIERYDDTGHAQLALYGWSPRSSGYHLATCPGEDVPGECLDQYGGQDIDCASPLEAMRVCRAMLGIRRVVVPLHPDEMAAGAGGAT